MLDRENDWITGYMRYTENTEPSPLYNKWVGVSLVASALQRKCFIDGWARETIYPNLYIILVGPTTAKKGTALRGRRFLEEPGMNIHLSVDSTSLASLIRDIKASQESYMDDDDRNIHIHSSLTVFVGELTTFIGYNQTELLTALTDWYDSTRKTWTHKTVQGGAQEIPGCWLNLIGGTTPELLRSALPIIAIGGGLIGRMLLIYASKKYQTIVNEMETEYEIGLREQLQNDLEIISSLGGRFIPSDKCLEAYGEWYEWFGPREEELCKDDRFLGYFGRKATTVRKLSLIMSASRSNEKVVTKGDFERALAFLDEMEVHMYRALQGVGKNQYAEIMRKIEAEIDRKKRITIQALLIRFMDDVTKLELENILLALDYAGFCTIVNGNMVVSNKENENEC